MYKTQRLHMIMTEFRFSLHKKTLPDFIWKGFLFIWSLAMTYFHMANATLSSARRGFTSEFGKGSGGSHSLWSPDKRGGICCCADNRICLTYCFQVV